VRDLQEMFSKQELQELLTVQELQSIFSPQDLQRIGFSKNEISKLHSRTK